MGISRSVDRRQEPRWPANLQVLVWGVDTQGERFLQDAHARDISLSGALLTGLDADLRSGDVIGILYGKKKARYRVIWIRCDGGGEKMQVAVHRMSADECPWRELLSEPAAAEQSGQSLERPSD
jgi:PilZ domain